MPLWKQHAMVVLGASHAEVPYRIQPKMILARNMGFQEAIARNLLMTARANMEFDQMSFECFESARYPLAISGQTDRETVQADGVGPGFTGTSVLRLRSGIVGISRARLHRDQ